MLMSAPRLSTNVEGPSLVAFALTPSRFSSRFTRLKPRCPPMCVAAGGTERPSGPHRVAVADVRLPDTVTPGLRLRLFYPTSSALTPQATWFPIPPTRSFTDETVLAILRFARLPAATALAPLLSSIAQASLPASKGGRPSQGRFPLVLFSHGLGGSIGNYSNACIDMASHGAVVAAPEHTDGSAFVAYVGEGRRDIPYVHYSPLTHGDSRAFRESQLDTRRADLLRVLDALKKGARLESLEEGEMAPALAESVDASTLVLAGHSFGAATVLSLAATKRGLASKVVCLDAWLQPLGERAVRSFDLGDTDVLFVDQALSNMGDSVSLREILPRSSGTGTADAVKVVGGMHNNASDFPLRVPRFIARAAGMTAKDSDPLALLQAQNRAVSAFLKGREVWREFRDRVRTGQEEGLALAPLGAARVLVKPQR